MRFVLAACLLTLASPAIAGNQTITISDQEQQALPAAWDSCVKQGGLACFGLYSFYVIQKPKPEPAPEAKPAPTEPPPTQ